MNCIDNNAICTKPKVNTSAILNPSRKEFTITIVDIVQIEDTLTIKYFINKSSNFSEGGYSCKIYSKHIDEHDFEESDVCVFSIQKQESLNVAVSGGKGNYNVCIDILYNETAYFSECQLADYEPVETTTEGQSTSDASETVPFTTISVSTEKSTMLITTSATTSVNTISLSTGRNTMHITSTAITTALAMSVNETPTTSLPEIYTTKPYDGTTQLPGEKTSLSTLHSSSPSEASMASTLAGITTKLPEYFETATPSMEPIKPFSAPSLKSFFLHKNAKGQLLLSWNVTLGDPQVACHLRFSVLLYNQLERNWQKECISGSLSLGDVEDTTSYRICVEMYLQQKYVEKNCTEFSPILPEAAASSKSAWLSSKLPMAAFIALVILAVIILILIIIVLIKLVHLKRNKTNVYYVAKEEVNNHGEVTKRNSKLYPVNSVDDHEV